MICRYYENFGNLLNGKLPGDALLLELALAAPGGPIQAVLAGEARVTVRMVQAFCYFAD